MNNFVIYEINSLYLPLQNKTKGKTMLIVQIKEGDNIEKALKKYKKKLRKPAW